MATLRIQLFGRFCASSAGREVFNFEGGKVQDLFCYLLLHRKVQARETLAGLFWGESDHSQAKKYLRKALWQLQATLEISFGPLNGRVILVEGDWVRLNPQFDLWVDVVAFEESVTSAGYSSDRPSDPAIVERLQEALQLYKGDLLEGCYQDWCLFERERLQRIYLTTLDHLICYSEANQLYQQALSYAAEVLRNDPAHERTHREMMRLHFALGDRTAAIRQYQRCATALKNDLGVAPSARTRKLLEKIQADDSEDLLALRPSEAPVQENDSGSLPEVLDHLKMFRSTLSMILQQVQKDIQKVELELTDRR
jgi:DNA-binding SARP family transcriptional activator